MRRDTLEGPSLAAPVDEIERRHADLSDVGVAVDAEDEHQALGIAKRKRTQQHGVHDAEHHGRGADAERERQRGGRREGGRAEERTNREAEILKHEPGISERRASVESRRLSEFPG